MADGRKRETKVTLYPLYGFQIASGNVLMRSEMSSFCWGNITVIECEITFGLRYVYLPFFSVIKDMNKFWSNEWQV